MILLVTAPFTQLNTPYPATAYIKGFLNEKSQQNFQLDLGIEVTLKLFSRAGLSKLLVAPPGKNWSKFGKKFLRKKADYLDQIDPVITFLQGKNPAFATQILTLCHLPMGDRFKGFDPEDWSYQQLDPADQAKYLATLFLEDIGDFIQQEIDPHFGFSRYAERLGRSANSFKEIDKELAKPTTLIQNWANEILREKMEQLQPELICFSIPFPGNLFSSLSCGKFIKTQFPSVKVALGGGFVNTELRDLTTTKVFQCCDFITLDDGERPLELILNHLKHKKHYFKRTFILNDHQVQYINNALEADLPFEQTGSPDYSDLKLDQYISVLEVANPMHRLWSDRVWNKLTMAHGCYWGKCTFCDISLDYIARYEPLKAEMIVNRMEIIAKQTGITGFHFVDEAAPPKLMRQVAEELIQRGLKLEWWTNVRFEKSFDLALCEILAKGGCIAVSGGLEVASDRLLQLIDKGVSVKQVAKVGQAFTDSGIMVHAYLMYGYPTQTVQETIDSLEYVRQLFEVGIIQSGYWHQFALTVHSPIFKDPEGYQIKILPSKIDFANNDVAYQDLSGIDHGQFSAGLKKAMYNFLHDYGYDLPLQDWFDFEVPATTLPPDLIESYLAQ